jgi:hypothetical protein
MRANSMSLQGCGQRVLTSSRPGRGSLKVACTATLEPTVSASLCHVKARSLLRLLGSSAAR